MKIIGDIHTHTLASGHAYGTVHENINAAKEIGLEVIGMAEHGPGIPGTCDPFYFRNMKAVPQHVDGVTVIMGCELNVTNAGAVKMDQETLKRLEYGIAGIHTLCYINEGKEKNTWNVVSCMKEPKVKLISHPDDDHTPLDYVELVRGAKENKVALEVNNSSFLKLEKRWNVLENYTMMLKECMEQRVPIIISSDAHDPSAVGRVDLAVKFVEEFGFDEELVLNTDKKRLLEFLEIKER